MECMEVGVWCRLWGHGKDQVAYELEVASRRSYGWLQAFGCFAL